MPQPVISFDLDGTLIRPDRTIHPRDREILASENRCLFIPATARLLPAVRRLFTRNGIIGNGPVPFPLVLQYGSTLFGPSETLLSSHELPAAAVDRLLNEITAHPSAALWLYRITDILGFQDNPDTLATAAHYDFDMLPYQPGLSRGPFTKAAVITGDPAALSAFFADLSWDGMDASFYADTILEISPLGVNKGAGLRELLGLLGIARPLVVAAGDSAYDLPLFAAAELSFAPLTAQPEVKEAATHLVDVEREGLLDPILRTIGL